MYTPLRLMCILAHPDDESLGVGSTLARYCAEGIETYLVTATRGERGYNGPPAENPGFQALAKIRTDELDSAARVLGIKEVSFLDYLDGDLDQADPAEVIGKLVTHLRRVRPHVVITFPPDGVYGHPDHIAISQLATSAVMCAADASFCDADNQGIHLTPKLYYMINTHSQVAYRQEIFGDLVMPVDGALRHMVGWEEWAVSAFIDAGQQWRAAYQAIRCHKSQLASYGDLDRLTDEQHHILWGQRSYYRAFSLVNHGHNLEHDLFEGLRYPAQVYFKKFAAVEDCR
jgi:LmbE family N-acetylglucosaminyl deacetylase